MPFFVRSEMPSFSPAPGCRLCSPGGQQLMLSWVEMEEGAEIPRHQHPHEQGGTVIEGQLQLTIGEETRIIQRGTMYLIPPDTPHSAVAIGGPVIVLDTFSPVREDYVAQMQSASDTSKEQQ